MSNEKRTQYTKQEHTWLEGLNAMGCIASVKEIHDYLKTCPDTLKYNPCVALALGIFLGKCIGNPELCSHNNVPENVKNAVFRMVNDIEEKYGVGCDE